jgi:hypothetical protein
MCEINWTIMLEYFKVFFSWPPVLALFLFWFVRRFTIQISGLISKIKGVKLPGGSEVLLSEAERQQETAKPPNIELPGSTKNIQEIKTANTDLIAHSPTLDAHATSDANETYSDRAKGLFPDVDPAPVVAWMGRNPGPAFDDYIDKIFQLHCERTFGIIFGTQVQVLEVLGESNQTQPIPSASLVPMYERHIELTGKSDRSLNDFVGFLTVRGLLLNVGTLEGPLYEITQAGKEFLDHIKRYYPLHWSSRAF